jgi:peptide/nickel transport system substrate-binding protein
MRGHVAVPGFPRQDLAKAKEFLAKSAYPTAASS